MRKQDIKVGGHYTALVSGKLTTVRVDETLNGAYGTKKTGGYTAYSCTNLANGRKTTFRSAAKFRGEAQKPTPTNVEEVCGKVIAGAKGLQVEAEPASPGHKAAVEVGQTQDPFARSDAAERATPGSDYGPLAQNDPNRRKPSARPTTGSSSSSTSEAIPSEGKQDRPFPATASSPASSPASAAAPAAAPSGSMNGVAATAPSAAASTADGVTLNPTAAAPPASPLARMLRRAVDASRTGRAREARCPMRRMVSAREIVGKKIVGFAPNPFKDGRGGIAHSPCIVLDDGSQLYFVTEETDVGEYGTWIGKTRKTRK